MRSAGCRPGGASGRVEALDRPEARRLLGPQPDPEPDQPQRQGEQERQPPPPAAQRRPVKGHAEERGRRDPGGQAERDGRPLPAAVPAAPVRRRILDHERRRPAVLSAGGHALPGPEQDQQDGASHPIQAEPGEHADGGGDHRHEQDAGRQRLPAAESVAVVGEEQGPGRAGDEGHAVDGEGREQRADGVGLGEEHRREDGGERAVQGEVVPLDKVADAAGDQGPPPRVGGGGLVDPVGLASDLGAPSLLHAPSLSEPDWCGRGRPAGP